MIDVLLLMMAALGSVLLPLVSLFIWTGLLMFISRYAREVFSSQVLWRTKDDVLRFSSYALTPIVFILTGVISAGFAVVVGIPLLYIMLNLYLSDAAVGMISLVSAGPIEETGKLLVAAGLYSILILMGKKVRAVSDIKGKNRVKDGILIGIFVGASFGFIESILYLIWGFVGIRQEGFMFQSMDPVIWRFVLGVSMHAVFTGIASAGLGQKGWKRKVAFTFPVLFIAAAVHSLNNGVSGFVSIVLGMDTLESILIVDAIQIMLVVFDFIILAVFWNFLSRNSS